MINGIQTSCSRKLRSCQTPVKSRAGINRFTAEHKTHRRRRRSDRHGRRSARRFVPETQPEGEERWSEALRLDRRTDGRVKSETILMDSITTHSEGKTIIHRRPSYLRCTERFHQGSSTSPLQHQESRNLHTHTHTHTELQLERINQPLLTNQKSRTLQQLCVWNEKPVQTKFILHGHDDLHLVQTVQSQILHEVRWDLKLREKHKGVSNQQQTNKQTTHTGAINDQEVPGLMIRKLQD